MGVWKLDILWHNALVLDALSVGLRNASLGKFPICTGEDIDVMMSQCPADMEKKLDPIRVDGIVGDFRGGWRGSRTRDHYNGSIQDRYNGNRSRLGSGLWLVSAGRRKLAES